MFHTPVLSRETRTAVHAPGKTYTKGKLRSLLQDIKLGFLRLPLKDLGSGTATLLSSNIRTPAKLEAIF
jgi:hypothetical protein